jgi:transposase
MTRDEFLALAQQSPEAAWSAFDLLQQQLATLAAEFAALKARLDKDSHNSNKPPSSDALAKKPAPTSLRSKTSRKPAGPRGHRGCTLLPTSTPDTIVSHVAPTCAHCGTSLADALVVGEQRRQVFDLPPLRLFVTEHRGQTRRCRCGACTWATFPPQASEPIQYGPRVKALGGYLRDYQLLPFARIAQLFADLFEAPLSTGMLVEALKQGARTLKPVHEATQQVLHNAPLAHFDETGMRVGARLHWLHSASTKTLTHYFCHARGGKEGSDAAGVLPYFLGRAVHEGWSSYARYACSHSLCNAHHLRELTPFAEAGEEWAAPENAGSSASL